LSVTGGLAPFVVVVGTGNLQVFQTPTMGTTSGAKERNGALFFLVEI
jgi:hypothetical protein